MPVPSRFPKEPNAQRCGDSYKRSVVVTGQIPGSDFGGHLKYELKPVFFRNGSVKDPPLFESRAALDAELDRSGGLIERLYQAAEDLGRNIGDFSDREAESLRWLITEIHSHVDLANYHADLIPPPPSPPPAIPGIGTHRMEVQAEVVDALQYLRCAEYWIHRVILVRQALRERPPEPFGLATAKIFDAPPLESLPVPTPDPPRLPKRRSAVPFVVAGAGALLVTGAIFYAVRA